MGTSGPSLPTPPLEGHQGTNLDAGKSARQARESFLEPPTGTQGDINVPPAVTASTPLSLQCRMCNASPTVGTRPTVTVCGHLFCSEYVLRISGSAAAELTPNQVHHTTCNVDFQMSCVRQRPVVISLVQTRSPDIILGV